MEVVVLGRLEVCGGVGCVRGAMAMPHTRRLGMLGRPGGGVDVTHGLGLRTVDGSQKESLQRVSQKEWLPSTPREERHNPIGQR